MSEKKQELLSKLVESITKLDENKTAVVVAYAEGAAMMAEKGVQND